MYTKDRIMFKIAETDELGPIILRAKQRHVKERLPSRKQFIQCDPRNHSVHPTLTRKLKSSTTEDWLKESQSMAKVHCKLIAGNQV